MNIPRLFCVLFFVSLAAAVRSEDTMVGKPFDLQRFIDDELKSGKKRIVVPPGRYRVAAKEHKASVTENQGRPRLNVIERGEAGQMHLLLANLDGVEIVADGVELICLERTRAITLLNCRNVRLSGLSLDYDPLPYTQGRIVKLSGDKMVHDIELFSDYPCPEPLTCSNYEIYDPASATLRFGSYYGCKTETLPDGAVRLAKADHYKTQPSPEQVGDIVVLGIMSPRALAHAIYLRGCSDVVVENVTVYASNCFGFFEQGCKGTTYLRCHVDRRAPQDDPQRRAVRRMRSLNADAFHSKNAVQGPRFIECSARFMGDDAVAINGDFFLVTGGTEEKARVLAKNEMWLKDGDRLQILTREGRLPGNQVVKVEEAGLITEEEKEYLRKQPLDERFTTNQNGILSKAYDVFLKKPVALPRGSVIAPADRMGNGFLVKDCDFGFNRSRGLVIKAGQGKIVGNKFTENWMSSVLLAPEYWWLEAGCGDNIEIAGNTILRCHDTAIRIAAELEQDKPLPPGAHTGIRITGNRIEDCPVPQIYVGSTDRIEVQGNQVRSHGLALDTANTVKAVNCLHLEMK
jgi:hypothetical protein